MLRVSLLSGMWAESLNAGKLFHVLKYKLESKLFSLLKTPLLYQLVFPFALKQL